MGRDAPLRGHVQVRRTETAMAQGTLQAHEPTAPLSEIAGGVLRDLRTLLDTLEEFESTSAIRTIRPEATPEGGGLAADLVAITNEVATLRLMVESITNRIGRL
jgi:hypothetical protein